MKHQIFIILVSFSFLIEAGRKNPYGVQLTAIQCEFGEMCERDLCKIKPINRTVTTVTVGCYLTRPQTNLKFKMEVFQKSSSNAYYPGSIRFVQDYCALARGETNAITRTFSESLKQLKEFFPLCPVKDKLMFENLPFDSSMFPSTLLPTGDYRLDMRTYNGLNETVMLTKEFITIKNPFF